MIGKDTGPKDHRKIQGSYKKTGPLEFLSPRCLVPSNQNVGSSCSCGFLGALQDHGTNLKDGDDYGSYAVYLSDDATFPCEDVTMGTVMPKKAVWKLALNVNPSDGHNFGYGGPWADDVALGSAGEALSKDFKDRDVMKTASKYLAIARHKNQKCDAVRVWQLADPSKTLLQRFQDENPGRQTASTGSPVFEYLKPGMAGSTTDPIFATKGKLMLNWWYSNNGARLALEDGSHFKGLLKDVSCTGCNDDDVHGLGNEFGANTKGGQGSTSWWHDAAQKMTLGSFVVGL